jgi:pimeloyl-ACP methyl ester carboxylesterase
LKLVFVHGAGNTSAVWSLQMEQFPGADAVDLPGHPTGLSHRTVRAYDEWLRDYIEEQGYEDVVLIGHSMGGAITLRHALRYPEQLLAIGLICTGAKIPIETALFQKLEESYESGLDYLAGLVFGPEVTPEALADWRQQKLCFEPAVLEGDFQACDSFDVTNWLEEIHLPTLIVGGPEDKLIDPGRSRLLHQRIAGSQLHLIPGAGHIVMKEKTAEFNRVLAGFLDSLPGAKR